MDTTSTRESAPHSSAPRRVAAKYLGIALLATYTSLLWLVDGSFYFRPVSSDSITGAWLINLITMSLVLVILLVICRRTRHLIRHRALVFVIPPATSAVSFAFCYLPVLPGTWGTVLFLGLSVALGALLVIMWVLWAECHACSGSRYSLGVVCTAFGTTFIVSVGICLVLPREVLPGFVSLLPGASGALLMSTVRHSGTRFPPLMPKSVASEARPTMVVVCAVSLVTTTACSFLGGIIPQDTVPFTQGLAIGTAFGGAVLFGLFGINAASGRRLTIFQLCPWVIIAALVAFALFLNGAATHLASFALAIGCLSIFQVLLIVYFGTLASKGYVPSTLTFGVSIVCIDCGTVIGDVLSLYYESLTLPMHDALTQTTCLVFICLLACLLIPLTRQEFLLNKLMSDPVPQSRIDLICEEMTREFGLSPREGELLKLLARGATTGRIAAKLTISPNTVNTHIRHIYEKTDIHSRGELLEYVTMRREEEE